MGKRKDGNCGPGVLLLAKRSGRTSFASLAAVKRALGTGRVGHTGTLDSFADGLLVVLAGPLTRLVPHITAFDKEYLALVEFGSETDTLDPTGSVVATGGIPSEEEVRAALPRFLGWTMQVPPAYSALHVGGRRASDLARSGVAAEIPPRRIFIGEIEMVEFRAPLALIRVRCSKGTYIRSLARDLARACGTVAHLAALRRTAVGRFRLEDAVGADGLPPFTLGRASAVGAAFDDFSEESLSKIRASLRPMSSALARECGMGAAFLSPHFSEEFANGRPISRSAFSRLFEPEGGPLPDDGDVAVFYPRGRFAGVVSRSGGRSSYSFVVPGARSLSVVPWEALASGGFPEELRSRGTAIAVGSFDGPHVGHDALFGDVLSRRVEGLSPGVVTFTRSLKGMRAGHPGDVATLSQRLGAFADRGFEFAVVIDFSDDFGRIDGIDFLRTLVERCGMRHLAEGRDFRCGHGGATDMDCIGAFSRGGGFSVTAVEPVMWGGERVSSSRLRESVLAADFGSARVMLGRPFSVDCSGFVWSSDGGFISAEGRGIQVLPPDGSYSVLVIVSAGKKSRQQSGEAQSSVGVRACRSDCILSGGRLRLPARGELIGGFVRAIQFGSPDEK